MVVRPFLACPFYRTIVAPLSPLSSLPLQPTLRTPDKTAFWTKLWRRFPLASCRPWQGGRNSTRLRFQNPFLSWRQKRRGTISIPDAYATQCLEITRPAVAHCSYIVQEMQTRRQSLFESMPVQSMFASCVRMLWACLYDKCGRAI